MESGGQLRCQRMASPRRKFHGDESKPVAVLTFVILAAVLGTAGAQQQGKIELQWFGQAAVKITSVSGKVIVIDPFLTTTQRRRSSTRTWMR